MKRKSDKKIVCVNLDRECIEYLRRRSKAYDRSVSWLVNDWVRNCLKIEKGNAELALLAEQQEKEKLLCQKQEPEM